jgi:parallel beta-helix repeat protein
MMGSPLTVSTCYIFPGVYHEEVEVPYNKKNGYFLFTGLSNTMPVLNGTNELDDGFNLYGSSRIKFDGLKIINYQYSGINMDINSVSNIIINCSIYSNQGGGISMWSGGIKYTRIVKNRISHNKWGVTGYQTGHNYICSNFIYKHINIGIDISQSSASNYIAGNLILSNSTGISFYGDDGDYIYDSVIRDNKIYGRGQNWGIYLGDSKNNIIEKNDIYGSRWGIYINDYSYSNWITGNRICFNMNEGIENNGVNNLLEDNDIIRNSGGGIYMWLSRSNIIVNNRICSNSTYGIWMLDNSSRISGNIISGPDQDYGINMQGSDNNIVSRNLISRNDLCGIHAYSGSDNTLIANNTIFKSSTGQGIYFQDTSSGEIINNIILSNGDSPGDHGVQNSGTGVVYVAYNDMYGNFSGPTNGTILWGSGNLFSDPLIDTADTFEIISVSSPAVDSGSNIPGISDIFLGFGPEMGWKEFDARPQAPFGLVAIALSKDTIKLIWNDLSNETSYTLFRSSATNSNSITFKIGLPADMENYINTGLKPDTIYYYWLKAYNIYGQSSYSDRANARTRPVGVYAVLPTSFNPKKHGRVMIHFGGETPDVDVKIYDAAGNIVRTFRDVSGKKHIEWDGRNYRNDLLNAGLYIVCIRGRNIYKVIKMIIIR